MKTTIRDAILEILKQENKPLSVKEIYDGIVERKLYAFEAKDPQSIVNSVIRKHCEGIELKKSRPEKDFVQVQGKYSLKKK